jgi:FKBP-type peptidyl-prolyl cis-trans isomerase
MKLVKLLVIIALFGAVSCKKSKTAANPKMKNKIDSLSYAAGSLFGQWLQTAGHKELDYEIMNAVIQRALNGDSLTMDIEQSKAILQSYAMEAMKKKSSENDKEAKDFLTKNKAKSGVITTASGLQYKILKAGNGPIPNDSQTVKVHYVGKLLDGKVFDSSRERGEPADFKLNVPAIPGWIEALKLMPVGSKWELYLPPALAYGEEGNQGIPGNSVLIFEVEVLELVADKPAAKK